MAVLIHTKLSQINSKTKNENKTKTKNKNKTTNKTTNKNKNKNNNKNINKNNKRIIIAKNQKQETMATLWVRGIVGKARVLLQPHRQSHQFQLADFVISADCLEAGLASFGAPGNARGEAMTCVSLVKNNDCTAERISTHNAMPTSFKITLHCSDANTSQPI